jgi:hypothetical protein
MNEKAPPAASGATYIGAREDKVVTFSRPQNGPPGAPQPQYLSGRADYGNQPPGILFPRATSSTL